MLERANYNETVWYQNHKKRIILEYPKFKITSGMNLKEKGVNFVQKYKIREKWSGNNSVELEKRQINNYPRKGCVKLVEPGGELDLS